MATGDSSAPLSSEKIGNAWFVPAMLFALTFPTLATWLYFVQFAGSPAVRIFYGVGKAIQFCFPVVYVVLAEGGFSALFSRRPASRDRISLRVSLIIGISVGMAVVLLMLGLYFILFRASEAFRTVPDEVRSKLRDAHIDSPAGFLALALFYSLIHSLLEEYYWRWFVFGRLRYVLSLWPAILLSSLGFMAHHTLVIGKYFGGLSTMTLLLSAGVTIGGAIWAWLYERSGLLYGSWLSHLLVDAGLMAIGYEMLWGF